jgi:hypothetical protein
MRPSENDLKILRERLPRGGQATIARRLRAKRVPHSRQTVSDALYGKIHNLAVIEEALLVAEEHEARMRELLRRIRTNKVAA